MGIFNEKAFLRDAKSAEQTWVNHFGFPFPRLTNTSKNNWHFQILVLLRDRKPFQKVLFEFDILYDPELFSIVLGFVSIEENYNLLVPITNVTLVFLR